MMHRIVIAVIVLGLLAPPASALGLGEAADLEHARANARSGGPISDRDAELLERYGCLSGTNNPFCKRLEQRWRHRAIRQKDYRDR